MKDQQKYFTEVSLLQATSGVALLKPAEFERVKKIPADKLAVINQAHVYFVCQRPRVRIVAVGNREAEGMRFTLEVSNKTNADSKEFLVPDKLLPSQVTSARAVDNGAYFTFAHGRDDISPLWPPEALLAGACGKLPELAKLEVVYIGQAYGDSGTRSVIDRLISHSTLQKVLAEQAHVSWWMEPVILLFIYDSPQIISKMDGRGTPEITGDVDMTHFKSILDEPLSNAQLVTIAEASLIRYFKPQYNIHFKGNYPTSEIEHLHDAYRLDYNAIITEIDTEDIFLSTFTKHQKLSEHHIAQFDLHDANERFSFFEITRDMQRRN